MCPAAASRAPAKSTTRRSPRRWTASATPASSAWRPGRPVTPQSRSTGSERRSTVRADRLLQLDWLAGTGVQRGDARLGDHGGGVPVPGARPSGYPVGAQPVDPVLQLAPVRLGEARSPV